MIRLIASDLDGTLLHNGAQTLNPEIFDLILALKEKGIRFAAASGRQYANLKRLFAPVANEISYIAENGSMTVDNGRILSTGEIDRSLANEIILDARTQPECSLLFSGPEKCYVILSDDLTKLSDTCLKVAICNFNGAEHSIGYFLEKYGHRIKIVTSGNIWFDFIAPNANKGSGLKTLADSLGILPEECMTFGDQYNDVEMLEFTPHSYAMTNCAAGVERHASGRTSSVEAVLKQLLNER